MSTNTTFQQYLQSAYTGGPWSTDEVIEFILPLFEEVLSFHENGQVGSFENPNTVFLTNGRLDIDEAFTHSPFLNLSDVKSMTVLKDASATAIFGSRGSNGVIIITTKRGFNRKPVT